MINYGFINSITQYEEKSDFNQCINSMLSLFDFMHGIKAQANNLIN